MTKEELYKEKLSELSEKEKKLRDQYLRKIALGEIQGPMTGNPEIDKPWLKFYDEDKISFDLPNMTVSDYITKNNKDNLESTALEYFGKKISYNELDEKTLETKKAFLKMGIKPGDVVSFCVPTLPETYYAWKALIDIGAIANMIDPRTNASTIKDFIEKSNSKMVFYIDIAAPKMIPIINELGIDNIVTMAASDSLPAHLKALLKLKDSFSKKTKTEKPNKNIINWKKFIKNGKDYEGDFPVIKDKLNQPCSVVYTSGTTGVSKGSLMTNKNFLAMVYQNKCANMGWEKNDIMLGIMPPFIAYGLVCGFSLPLCNGMQVDIIPKFEADKFDSYILKHKPNHIMGVPSYLDSLTTSEKLKDKDLSFIKTAIVGGDKMVISSEKKVNEFLKAHNSNAKISKGYGMTEMSSNAIYTINDDCNELGSVGVPLIGNGFKIINKDGETLTYNQIGEVCLTGPTLINGYFNNESETKKAFVVEDGQRWIHTGDHAIMNKDGVVTFYDRIKRIIVRSDGHNVWPSRIEKIIESNPKVLKCCVTGVKESEHNNGEIPTAFLVIKDEFLPETQEIIDELNEDCLSKLPERDIALQYVVKDELPLTPVGKIDYRKLSSEGVELMKSKKMILAKK